MGLPSHCQQVLMMIIEKGQQAEEQTATPQSPRACAQQERLQGKETSRDETTLSNQQSGSKRNLQETSTDQETTDTVEPCAKRHSPDKNMITTVDCSQTIADKSWAADESFVSPSAVLPGYTPQQQQRRRSSSRRLSVESLFSPNTIDSSLETLLSDLRKENEALKEELATSQQREADLGQKMEESGVSFRKEMMKLESTSLQREEESREAYSEEMAGLRQKLEDTKAALETEQRAHRELESVRDEMDVLKHTKDKLAETEEKLRVCRERMEQLGDVKEALSREEEAHAARVEECLRLENEINTLQPLRRQLEDYKTRAIDAEVKLAECQEDLKRMATVTGNLNSAQKEILKGAKVHKEEAEELRRRLLDEENVALEGPGVGEGVSELNPVLMEEMARLRNENIRLKAFAAAREDDAVQMLGERLDDSQRLSERYKEQFLSCKNELEQTQQKLKESQENVASLNDQVQALTSRLEELGQELGECKSQLSKTTDDLAHTSRLLQESKEREESLRSDVERLSTEVSDANDLAAARLEQIEHTTRQLEETSVSLKATQKEEQRLQLEVNEWTDKTAAVEAAFLSCEDQLASTKGLLEESAASLDAALDREATLKGAVTDLETARTTLEEKLEESARSAQDAMLAAETERDESLRSLSEKASTELQQVRENLNTLLESQRATFEEKMATASEEHSKLKEQSVRELSLLEEKYKHDLQVTTDDNQETCKQLKEKYELEISSIQQAAVDERENLVKKGKSMLKETKEKAKREVADAQEQLRSIESELAELRVKYEEYEKKTKKQLANYKKKNGIATSRIAELSQNNDTLEDTVKGLERERFKAQEENERFRRQLGGRFGADGKVQNQLETLRNEFDAMLEENRELKKKVAQVGESINAGLSSITESDETTGSGRSSYTRGGASGSTLTQLRKEYEETIETLTDAKRELVMRNSAAITDVQKAEQRAWESDKQVQRLKEELTSLKLKLQRLQQVSEDYYDALSGPLQDELIKENTHARRDEARSHVSTSESTTAKDCSSADKDEILLDLSHSDDRALPLVESTNEKRGRNDSAGPSDASSAAASKPKINAYEFPTAQEMRRRTTPAVDNETTEKNTVPSLMDYAISSQEDAQPECKQS